MNRFARRRIRNSVLTLLALAVVWVWVRAKEASLEQSAFGTGYLLLSALGFLALYNVRKKLPFLPLGTSTAWLQWHLYVGMGSIGVFALHAGPALPNGILESALAVTYWSTVASGIAGLYFTRVIPAQLSRIGQEAIYEQIPALRRAVWRRADEVVLGSVAASGATTLAEFYSGRLHAYFARPRRLWYQLRPTTAARRGLLSEIQDVRRYLADQEQPACEELFALVRRKDELDFQEARQKLLKVWLFVHIGLSYVLVLLAVLHGLLALAFRGGAA
jgi:hypothetical protein